MPSSTDPLSILRAAHPELEAANPGEALAVLGSVTEALPYRQLFWPTVVTLGDAFIVDLFDVGTEVIEQRLQNKLVQGDPGRGVEAWRSWVHSFNYYEIGSIFQNWHGETDSREETQIALAESMIAPWEARIRLTGPKHPFCVRVARPDPSLGICIEVLQELDGSKCPRGW